jgi:hypothetical protein
MSVELGRPCRITRDLAGRGNNSAPLPNSTVATITVATDGGDDQPPADVTHERQPFGAARR